MITSRSDCCGDGENDRSLDNYWYKVLPYSKARVLFSCETVIGPDIVFQRDQDCQKLFVFHIAVVNAEYRQRGIASKLVKMSVQVILYVYVHA